MARGKKRKGFNFNSRMDVINKLNWLEAAFQKGDITQDVFFVSYKILRGQLNSITKERT